jgi:O-antigen/teichoic acid export membrane protein
LSGIVTPDAVVSNQPLAEAAAAPPQRDDQLRRVGSQTAVYTVGVLVARAFSFLLLPVYTRYLSPADYGIIQLVDLTFDVLTLVAGTRIASGLFHFHEKATSPAEKNAVLSTTMLALAAAYTVVALAAALFATALSEMISGTTEHALLIRIAATSFVFQGLLIVPLAEIRRREKPRLFIAVNIGKLAVQAALNVFFLVVMGYGVLSMFLSTLITSAVLGVALTVYFLRQTGVGFSGGVLRDLVRFGLPLVATQAATIFTTFGDRFFLRRAVDDAFPADLTAGVAAVGIYALAYQFAFLLATVALDPFTSVWHPVRFKFAKQENRDEIFARAFVMLNVMLVTVGVGIGLFVHDILTILAAPAFRSASEYVPVLLLAYVVASWPAALDTGIMLKERNGLITLANWAAAAVALVGYIVLIPLFFGWGAVWITLAAALTRHIIIYRASQRLWPIRYDWSPIGKLLVMGTLLVGLRMLMPDYGIVVSLAVSTGLLAIYAAMLWYSDILPMSIRGSLSGIVRAPRGGLANVLEERSPEPIQPSVLTHFAPVARTYRPERSGNARMIRVIGREELAQKLEWGMEFFTGERYDLARWPAVDLLSARRFDLLAKAVFAEHVVRGVRSDFGERVYAEHINVWNGFNESKPFKSGRRDFVESFRRLISTLAREGFSPDKSLVPIDRNGEIIEGAHRVAAQIATAQTVDVVQAETALQDRQVPAYDYRFFAENRSFVTSGLTEYYSDEMARTYCRLRPDARLVVLFPVGNRRHDEKVLEILADVGNVVYARSFLLGKTGAFQFIRHLYQHDKRDWMGTRRDGFAGAREKARRCFAAFAPCRIILLDPDPDADLVAVKNRIRQLYANHDAVHITDTAEELPVVGGFVFNSNSIDFFNRFRPRTFERFDSLFLRYSEKVDESGVSREDVCVHGSACIAAAGLRECRDFDFLGFSAPGETRGAIEAPGISLRANDPLITPEYSDAVIFDPANHFWYYGRKFATLKVIRRYKLDRSEAPKDHADVALIDQMLQPTPWDRAVSAYFSTVGLRTGSPRDLLRWGLARVGLLEHVRRLRGQ